jgi:hypothetical protein
MLISFYEINIDSYDKNYYYFVIQSRKIDDILIINWKIIKSQYLNLEMIVE